MSVSVGIDISAKKVDMVIRADNKASKAIQFEQSTRGHKALISCLIKAKPDIVVLEATGVYYIDLAIALSDAKLAVSVVNPLSTHHFAKATLRQAKTDAIDTNFLAQYGQLMQPARWHAPDKVARQLRDLGRHINRLIHEWARAKNKLHALESTKTTPRVLIQDEKLGIRQLDKRIDKLRKAADELLHSQPNTNAAFNNLCTAVGVGGASALAILAEMSVLPHHLKSKQVVRQAGLDVRVTQSGSSVDKPGRMSKAGNAHLRTALFYPAMSAARHDQVVNAFYEKLLAKGKKKKQALVAIMRKYLTGLWICYQTGEPFDSAKLFDINQLDFKQSICARGKAPPSQDLPTEHVRYAFPRRSVGTRWHTLCFRA